MATVANNPSVIDSSLQKLVEAFNAELGPDEQSNRIVFAQESVGGRTWSTMKPGGLPIGITWTYDRGYMVAGSDRGVAERAIATRNGGSPLAGLRSSSASCPRRPGSIRRRSPGSTPRGRSECCRPWPQPGAGRAHGRPRSDPRGVRRNTELDPRSQPSRCLQDDHGRDADREPGPDLTAIADMDMSTPTARHATSAGEQREAHTNERDDKRSEPRRSDRKRLARTGERGASP